MKITIDSDDYYQVLRNSVRDYLATNYEIYVTPDRLMLKYLDASKIDLEIAPSDEIRVNLGDLESHDKTALNVAEYVREGL